MEHEVFAYINSKSILKKSSSGGAYTAIVDAIYSIIEDDSKDNNPVVFGATFDEEFNVIHKAAYNKQECEQFRGSKYVQSKLGSTIKEIEKYLKMGRVVLFTGTPCQIYSIKHYLNNRNIDCNNFYSVDIICHGTPNPKLWKEFKEWLEKKNKSKLKDFSFRYKDAKWKEYAAMAQFENGTKKVNTQDVRLFTALFFTHFIMKEACYNCKFANLDRVGDLTIGDFWGADKVMSTFLNDNRIDTSDGISLILVNSLKGKYLIDIINRISISENKGILKQCHSDKYIKYQNNLNKPISKPSNSKTFWKEFDEKGFEYIINKYGGYNANGKVKFYIKKIMNEIGAVSFVKKIINK